MAVVGAGLCLGERRDFTALVGSLFRAEGAMHEMA
jgi:hypothetical protein